MRQPGGLEEPEETAAEALSPEPDRALLMLLEERAAWAYPYAVSASIPAKKGVSELTHGELYEQTRFSARPTHGVLSGDAINKINESPIEKMIISDSIDQKDKNLSEKFIILSCSELIGEAIHRIFDEDSVSSLFEEKMPAS